MKIKTLKSTDFPEKDIYNKLVRMKLQGGGVITETWKACVKYRHAKRTSRYSEEDYSIFDKNDRCDNFYDTYIDHKAYYVTDDDGQILGWAFVMIGSFDKNPYKIFGSIQFFTKKAARGKGIARSLFVKCLEYLRSKNVTNIFYYHSGSNEGFFNKMAKEYLNKNECLLDVYEDLYRRKNPVIRYKKCFSGYNYAPTCSHIETYFETELIYS